MATASKPRAAKVPGSKSQVPGKPRVKKKLAEVETNGHGRKIPGLARDVTVELVCTCGRKYWVFKDDQELHPVCGFCADRELALKIPPAADNLLPPAVAELMQESEAAENQATEHTEATENVQTKNQKTSVNSVPSVAHSQASGFQRLPLARIARNRFNPRSDFPKEEIAELAVSLEANGQLQPVVVRRVAAGLWLEAIASDAADFEIVAGERRALAADVLGWTEIDVIVRECDDALASKLAIEENRQRRDISQIELARGVKRRMELAQLDVAGVAADLALDVSTVRNLFRLLDAPEAWQQRVISREISGTHLRHALPYLHAPAIEAALAKHVDERIKEEGQFGESEKRWQWTIEDTVRQKAARLSRNVHTNENGCRSTELRIDKKDPRYAELDVVTIKSNWGGAAQYALNAKLANAILSEKAKAWHAKHGGKKGAKEGKGKEPTAAELKKQAAAAKAEREAALASLVYDWRRWLCSQEIEHSALADDVCLIAAIDEGILGATSYHAGQATVEMLCGKKSKASVAEAWLKADHKLREELISRFARESFWSSEQAGRARSHWDIERHGQELLVWCAKLGVDLAAAWRAKTDEGTQAFCGPLTDRFFELLTIEDLRELAGEWKLAVGGDEREASLIKKLRNSPERVFPLPRILADAAGTTKKRKAK